MRLTLGSTMVHTIGNLATAGWYLVAVGAPMYAGWTVVTVLTTWSLSPPMPRMGAPVRVDSGGLDDMTGRLPVETLSTAAGLGCIALWLAAVLVWLPAIGGFRRLMRTVVADGPFVARNVEQLGRLGVMLIVVSTLSGVALSAMSLVAATAESYDEIYSIAVQIQLGWLLLGLVTVALAEVFRFGVDLRTDSELTI